MVTITTLQELYGIYLQTGRVGIDSRRMSAGGVFFALRGQTDGNRYAASALETGADYVVIDDPAAVVEGDNRYLLVKDGLSTLQQLARHHRMTFQMPVLAITGSNGKTTTKELIRAVMETTYVVHATPGNYNNHIGLPLTILSTPREAELLILEMGANHQGEIAELCTIGRPTHGVITNVGDAHLEGFGGKEGVRKGKGELYQWLATNRGIVFINQNEAHLGDMAVVAGDLRVINYLDSENPDPGQPGLETKIHQLHPHIIVSFLDRGARTQEQAELSLSGQHNLQNAKTAIAIGKYFKVKGSAIADALSAYRSQNHRSQWMEVNGIRTYFDAYNANPSSVAAALRNFSRQSNPTSSVIVLGEMLELGTASPAAHRSAALLAGQVAQIVLLVGPELKEAATEFERPWFPNSEALSAWLWQQDWTGKTLFVKGSRGNKLERILNFDD